MAVRGQFQVVESYEADGDYSSNRYYLMKLTSGQLDLCDGVTDQPIGVLQDKPDAAGKLGTVCIFGHTKLVAGAAITTVGQLLSVDATGRAQTVTPGTETTEYIIGRALTAAASAGDIFEAFVDCVAPARAA